MVICVRKKEILKRLLHFERIYFHICNRLPCGRVVMLFFFFLNPVAPENIGEREECCPEKAQHEKKTGQHYMKREGSVGR